MACAGKVIETSTFSSRFREAPTPLRARSLNRLGRQRPGHTQDEWSWKESSKIRRVVLEMYVWRCLGNLKELPQMHRCQQDRQHADVERPGPTRAVPLRPLAC